MLPHTSSVTADGFDFGSTPKNPAGEPTKPKKASKPPPVKLQEPRLDLNAKADYKDQDHVFVQTSPHIFQRKQGGWNAKLPEVDLDDSETIVESTQVSSTESQHGQSTALNSKNRGEVSMIMALTPTWTAQRTLNKRQIAFNIVDASKPAYEVEIQSRGGQASNVQNGKLDPSDRIKYDTARSREIHNPVRDKSGRIDLSRRVLWQHSVVESMSINKFLHTVSGCKERGLSESDNGLIKRLMSRLSTVYEHPFIGGRYLMPLALRYDNQDVSKYTVEKTCIFFTFPYLCLSTGSLRKYYENSVEHPPRTLLQSHYRLNKTEDRDKLQCVRWLEAHKPKSCAMTREPKKKNGSSDQFQELLFVPQLWGLVVGSDTLITSSCCDEQTLCGSDIELKPHGPVLTPKKLSLLRILFYHNHELEELIYPIHKCDSCFGLLNKKQQILEFLAEETASEIKSREYLLRRDDDGLQITFNNWGSILEQSQGSEILSICMEMKSSATVEQAPKNIDSGINQASQQAAPVTIQSSTPAPKTPPFLEWPMQDEFGERETLHVEKRLSTFLRAIYLGLPTPNRVTKIEGARSSQTFSEKRAQAIEASIQPTTFSKLQVNIKSSLSLEGIGQEFLIKAKELMLLFISPSHGLDSNHQAIGIFWGAVSMILLEAAKEPPFQEHLQAFIGELDLIIEKAIHLHQGVHCSRSKEVPGKSEWRNVDAMADGTVLLSAVVDAFGSIFHMFLEVVRYVKSSSVEKGAGLMAEPFKVVQHARESVSLLDKARDQLIREADGRDGNDTIGPVLTPEAITITLIQRLVSGVHGSGTLDVIGLYEECLEYLTLKVKYEASRRLLQRINEFSEEVAIVNDVLKQQNNVLLQIRSSLDPASFSAPSLARKLRFEYERKGIDKVLTTIEEHLRAYAELRDRAKQLSIENVQLVETLQDDNSKAILIFTMVTILFLPLSFVTGFFGMNLNGISGTDSGVRHFWAIALPLTAGIVIVCIVFAIKGEDTYFAFARAWRYWRILFSSRL